MSRVLQRISKRFSTFTSIDTIPLSKITQFHEDGYAVIPDFLTESETSEIEEIYDKFISKEISIPGADFCDMSQPNGSYIKDLSKMNVINVMLPRIYYPSWQNNIYEKKTRYFISKLFPNKKMDIDYDQLLAKKPNKPNAVFLMHQDNAYWPNLGLIDMSTCTFSLALDNVTINNGAIGFLPKSHLENKLREHKMFGENREQSHAIHCKITETEKNKLVYGEVKRGGITIHNHTIVHGSYGNYTDIWRRTYVIAYRTKEAIQYERSIGFTHSHNDTQSWDEHHKWK